MTDLVEALEASVDTRTRNHRAKSDGRIASEIRISAHSLASLLDDLPDDLTVRELRDDAREIALGRCETD